MSFKVILAATGLEHSGSDIDAAIELARAANAHLSVCVVALGSPPPIGEYTMVLADAWVEQRQALIDNLKSRCAAIDARLADAGISADADSLYAELNAADMEFGQRARLADVTLVGADMLADADMRPSIVEGALFESARPVLLAPRGSGATLAPRRVVVAWDGRIEAARAVREALDMLAGADSVRLTMVDPAATGDGIEPGSDLAAYLARHGVNTTIDRLSAGGRATGDVLRRHALDVGADLVVMGGYGHSRLRERIFGGVTRSMIEEAGVAVLMAR
ncbi:MAG: universal stress protein [Rhizobiaceae bacterium]